MALGAGGLLGGDEETGQQPGFHHIAQGGGAVIARQRQAIGSGGTVGSSGSTGTGGSTGGTRPIGGGGGRPINQNVDKV